MSRQNIFGKYDEIVLKQRLEKYLSEIEKIQKQHHCEKAIVMGGGDLISGNIHAEIKRNNNLNIIEQIITVSEYIKMSKEFRNNVDKKSALSSMYTDYLCACIRDVVGRTFKDEKDRNSYLKGYIENLCMAKDKKLLKQIINETIIKIEPFKLICESCGRETEVVVSPTSNFQQ